MKVINLGTQDNASFYVACELYKEMAFNQHCILGLATGGTMTTLYAQLVKLLKGNQLDVSHVTAFNLDEYVGLTPDHPQSYHYYMNQVLFDQYPHFNREQIYIPNGDAEDLTSEVQSYEQHLTEQGPQDIQILGIGENGHIGFNEPGTPFDSRTQVVDLTESTIKANSRYFEDEADVPHQAVSMGLASIYQAKRIILLAFGEKKQRAIEQLLCGDVSTDLPASILRQHPNVEVYVDDAAMPDDIKNVIPNYF